MRYFARCTLLAAACTLAAVAAQENAAAQIAAVPPPFRVVAAARTEVRVDLGAARRAASSLRRATVLGRTGAVRATLVRTDRVCEVLCPGSDDEDGGKECHFEAVLRAAAPVDDAVAVLAGSADVRAIAAVSVGERLPLGPPDRWIEAEPIKAGSGTFRWTRFPDGVFLTLDDYGRDHYAPAIDLAECVLRPAAPFTIVSCPAAEVLYEGSRGLTVSFSDCGEATVEPLIRFRLDGREAVVIRLGLKGAVATALLVRAADGRWRLTTRGFDYALLC
jgi:hypothetical protein